MAWNNYAQSAYPYGNSYGQPMNYGVQQQSYAPQQSQIQPGIIWVDGEVGAKAFQMPQGWPVGTPIPLWDTNDPVIYLKSINQMGMPNPLQKIHYQMEEQQAQSRLPAGQMSGNNQSATGDYVTKSDFEAMKNELREMLKNQQPAANQNGSQNGQNRGVNR